MKQLYICIWIISVSFFAFILVSGFIVLNRSKNEYVIKFASLLKTIIVAAGYLASSYIGSVSIDGTASFSRGLINPLLVFGLFLRNMSDNAIFPAMVGDVIGLLSAMFITFIFWSLVFKDEDLFGSIKPDKEGNVIAAIPSAIVFFVIAIIGAFGNFKIDFAVFLFIAIFVAKLVYPKKGISTFNPIFLLGSLIIGAIVNIKSFRENVLYFIKIQVIDLAAVSLVGVILYAQNL